MIEAIKAAVTIPVMAKARIGHFVEAQILEALGVDYVDESEVLTPADETHHIDKWAFTVPFVCGATNLGEALRRISEGACLIRSKGEAGTGNIVEAVAPPAQHHRRHAQAHPGRLRRAVRLGQAAAGPAAARAGDRRDSAGSRSRCSVPAASPPRPTPRLAMQLGAEAVFVGSGIFKSDDPAPRAKAIVEATAHFRDAHILAKVSRGLGTPMTGIGMDELDLRLADRGW